MKKSLASILTLSLFAGCASNSGGEYGGMAKTVQDLALITLITLPITIPVAIITAPIVLPIEALKNKQTQTPDVPEHLEKTLVEVQVQLLKDNEYSAPALAYDGQKYKGWISIYKEDSKQEWLTYYQKDFQQIATVMSKERPHEAWRAYELKTQWFILDKSCNPLGKLGIVSKKFEPIQELDEQYLTVRDLCKS